ncbi:MAG: chemotaxis protein CheC [Planctomycetaceae bacterium]|nr:chemotaxis protein CheC [Planctomycetaceae bacterium]
MSEVELIVELGQMSLPTESVKHLAVGALVTLNEFPGDPVAIHANGKLMGRGEVVVVAGKLGIRLTELFPA